MIATELLSHPEAQGDVARESSESMAPRIGKWLDSDRLQNQAGIASAEAERVRDDDVDRVRLGVVGHVIEAAAGVGIVEVDRGRDGLVL